MNKIFSRKKRKKKKFVGMKLNDSYKTKYPKKRFIAEKNNLTYDI